MKKLLAFFFPCMEADWKAKHEKYSALKINDLLLWVRGLEKFELTG